MNSVIHIRTRDREPMEAFYRTVGFHVHESGCFTDGCLRVLLSTDDRSSGMIAVDSDVPNSGHFEEGVPSLEPLSLPPNLPDVHDLHHFDEDSLFAPETYPNSVLGLFGEWMFPVDDLENRLPFWERMGFSTLEKHLGPYPWAVVHGGGLSVGLHQTGTLARPALTYYAADVEPRVRALEKIPGVQIYPVESPHRSARKYSFAGPDGQFWQLFSLL